MDPLDLIKTLCYTVENQTRFVCEGLTEEDVRWRPVEPKCPAIGWHVGHIIVLHDIMINHRICENSMLFPELVNQFGFATEGDFPDSFTLEGLYDNFRKLNGTIVEIVLSKDPKWLDEMFNTEGFPPNWLGKSRGKGFALAINHGIAHSGQILEVKRMLGKGAWGF